MVILANIAVTSIQPGDRNYQMLVEILIIMSLNNIRSNCHDSHFTLYNMSYTTFRINVLIKVTHIYTLYSL